MFDIIPNHKKGNLTLNFDLILNEHVLNHDMSQDAINIKQTINHALVDASIGKYHLWLPSSTIKKLTNMTDVKWNHLSQRN